MHIILNWSDYTDIGVVTEEDGTPVLLNSYDEALVYGKENLNFFWKAVDTNLLSYTKVYNLHIVYIYDD